MKIIRLLSLLIGLHSVNALALGPQELHFAGNQYYKANERMADGSLIAEYEPFNRRLPSSIVITHVLDKNEPHRIATGLKEKQSVAVVEIENLKEDRSDVMVQFMQFDLPRVKNNLCRITKDPVQGSVVFQYVETQIMRDQNEGAVQPDFTQASADMKLLPINQYSTALAQHMPNDRQVPWFKRRGSWAGPQNRQPAKFAGRQGDTYPEAVPDRPKRRFFGFKF